ncbi:MAG: alpha/beta fold hydrolase [Segniliparus sp.]|uniref:alpha/beta fold hydrolase n=1 Tax=Segniliparus sp. TaxID=2804064 RepID=UPI003F31F9D7
MELARTIRGSGPTLVLVHGIVHQQHAWDAVVDELARSCRVVTVDLPGHGLSPQLPDDTGDNVFMWLADEVERFVREVAPEDGAVHIAGNSLGGGLALEMAARGAVRSAVGIAPAGFFVGEWDIRRTLAAFRVLRFAARRLEPFADRLMGNVVIRSIANFAFYAKPWRVPPAQAAADVRSIARNELLDRVAGEMAFTQPVREDVPVRVLWCRRDFMLPWYQAKQVRSVFPHAVVTMAPGLGHVPMADDPALVARTLLDQVELAGVRL